MVDAVAQRQRGVSLRTWMIVVGVIYVVMGLRLLPWINEPMIRTIGVDAFYTGGDLTPSAPAFDFILDWMGTFGLDRIVLGAALLAAALDADRNRLLAWVVIACELTAGILSDVWLVSRDYVVAAPYIAFIAVHLAIVATGYVALRSTRRNGTTVPTVKPSRVRGFAVPSGTSRRGATSR